MTDNSFNKQNLRNIPNLSDDCFKRVVDGDLNILFNGTYIDHETGETLLFKDGQMTRVINEAEKTKELTDIEDGKVKKVIYRCDKYYYGCNVGPAGTKMFENGLKEMEKMINDYTNEGNSKAAAKASKRLAKMKSDFQLEKDTTSCNCQRKRTPTISYE